ncbi:MAG: alpha/beta hydrolase [Anaerolineales bacterium]|jgi:pimeloyl-ACP methyl ester carboxylesterase
MQSMYVKARDLKFHILHWQPDDIQARALCLHGLGYNAQFWRLVGPLLAEAGIEVFALDARGHGLSDKPQSGYDIATNTQDILAIARELGLKRPILIGHSWGGVQALDFCVAKSEQDPQPRALVLIDGGFGQFDQIPGASWDLVRNALSPPDWEGRTLAELLARLDKPDRRWNPQGEARQAFLADFAIHPDQTISPHLSLAHYQTLLGDIWRYPTFSHFSQVDCPVLALAVRLDPPLSLFDQAHQFFNQRGVEEAEKGLEEVEIHWIEHGVHEVPLHQPELLAELITHFVQSHNDDSAHG